MQYGTEFLHDDSHGRVPPLERLLVYQIPIEIVLWLAQPQQYNRVINEDIDWLIKSIEAHGVREPLELKCDNQGHVCLQEGHHRLRASVVLQSSHLPLTLRAPVRTALRGHRRQVAPPGTDLHAWMRLMEDL